LNVCEDSVALPAVGEVVLSPDDDSGGNNIAEKTRVNGDEICLVSGSRSLPEELFVFVATLDGRWYSAASCDRHDLQWQWTGTSGLAPNCVGQRDCFVDIMYMNLVTKKGNNEVDFIQLSAAESHNQRCTS
jgi:hypothetical protein